MTRLEFNPSSVPGIGPARTPCIGASIGPWPFVIERDVYTVSLSLSPKKQRTKFWQNETGLTVWQKQSLDWRIQLGHLPSSTSLINRVEVVCKLPVELKAMLLFKKGVFSPDNSQHWRHWHVKLAWFDLVSLDLCILSTLSWSSIWRRRRRRVLHGALPAGSQLALLRSWLWMHRI